MIAASLNHPKWHGIFMVHNSVSPPWTKLQSLQTFPSIWVSGPLPQWICFFSTVWLLKVCVAKSDLFGITVRRVLDAGYDVESWNLCAAIAQHLKIQLSSLLLQHVQTGDALGHAKCIKQLVLFNGKLQCDLIAKIPAASHTSHSMALSFFSTYQRRVITTHHLHIPMEHSVEVQPIQRTES